MQEKTGSVWRFAAIFLVLSAVTHLLHCFSMGASILWFLVHRGGHVLCGVGWHACASIQILLQGVQAGREHHRAHVWDQHHHLRLLWLARPLVLRMGVQPSATSAGDYLLSPVVSDWVFESTSSVARFIVSARADYTTTLSVFGPVGLWIFGGRSSVAMRLVLELLHVFIRARVDSGHLLSGWSENHSTLCGA